MHASCGGFFSSPLLGGVPNLRLLFACQERAVVALIGHRLKKLSRSVWLNQVRTRLVYLVLVLVASSILKKKVYSGKNQHNSESLPLRNFFFIFLTRTLRYLFVCGQVIDS